MFKSQQLISESLEFLHLDGTSIKKLPPTIRNLRRLVTLNMRNCKMLEFLPDCICELTLLEELTLSGCSMLRNFPYNKKSLTHLQILLIDGTGAEEMPRVSYFTSVNRVSLLHRLCLSGNHFLSLQADISQLHHLKWLDVKHCKKLRSVPVLPPRLEYFDAHGCHSLEKVANPLTLPLEATEQIHATFIFSNCRKLDQDAKDSIISYTRRKIQLVLDALSRYHGVRLFLYMSNIHFFLASCVIYIYIYMTFWHLFGRELPRKLWLDLVFLVGKYLHGLVTEHLDHC